MSILYSGFQIQIQNCGYFSTPIITTRSLHQGGPASNALFLVVAELLAIAIRTDPQIRGVSYKEILSVLNQFADDLDVFLNDVESIERVLCRFHEFQQSTGFKLSYDKTTLYRVESLKSAKAQVYTNPHQLKTTTETINMLGVDIMSNDDKAASVNYQRVIDKIDPILKRWSKRSLSLFGKIQVVNSLIGSLFVYKMSVLCCISKKMLQDIMFKVESFIWAGHKPKIPARVLQLPASEGGANLVNFVAKDYSLKMSWVRMVMDQQYDKDLVYNIIEPKVREVIWTCNLKDSDSTMLPCTNKFWQEVMLVWCKYLYTEVQEVDQVLWYNSNIQVNNSPIVWYHAVERGLWYVSQLYQNGQIRSHGSLREEFGLTTLQINTIVSALPKQYHKAGRAGHTYVDQKFAAYMHSPRPVKFAYNEFNVCPTATSDVTRKSVKWEEELAIGDISIIAYVQYARAITTIAKLRSFQYRLLMRAIITNVHLMRWGKASSNLCSFCNQCRESYSHLFFECTKVQIVWEEVKRICVSRNYDEPELTVANVLLNQVAEDPQSVTNFICLAIKQYIYAHRCQKLNLSKHEVTNVVEKYRSIEKYYAIKDNTYCKYLMKWEKSCMSEEIRKQIDLKM